MLPVLEKHFNQTMAHHWQQIIDFLKLHYVLSQRDDSAYWRDMRDEQTIPDSLQEKLLLWQYEGPGIFDAPLAKELFPAASWQYIWYGMGGRSVMPDTRQRQQQREQAGQQFKAVAQKTHALVNSLPGNRELIRKIQAFGLQTI